MRWLIDRWVGVATSLAVFILLSVPIYTVGFSFPEDWAFPIRAISYWWGQHEAARVGVLAKVRGVDSKAHATRASRRQSP